jgi:hypothetical protein
MRRSSRPRQGGQRSRHSQRSGLEVRPSFWLVRATIETPTPPARGTGTLTTPSNVMNSRRLMGSPLLTSAPYHIVERENGRCALQQILSAMTEMVGSMSGLPPRKRPQSGHRLQRLKRVKHRQHNGDISNRSDCHGPESRREQRQRMV